jgi:ligand-binding sensor domain-containing protein
MKRLLLLSLFIAFLFSSLIHALPDTSQVKNWYNTNYVTSMERTGSRLAIGSTKGVILFTPQDSGFVILNKADGILDNQVNALGANDENIFICVPSGITVLASDTSRIRNISTSFTGLVGEPQAVLLKGDTVFLGTTGYLYIWDTEGNPYNPFNLAWTNNPYSLRNRGINALFAVQDTLYAGTDGGGLCMIPDNHFSDTTQWVWNTTGDGLPNDTVTAIEEFSSVTFFIGTRQGIVRGRMGNWTLSNAGLFNAIINELLNTNGDTLWAATEGAPHWWDDLNTIWRRVNSGLGSNQRVRSLATDSADSLWIGLYGDGIAKNDTVWLPQRIPGPSSSNFSDIAIDEQGGIWGVHYGGFVQEPRWYTISHFDGVRWEILNDPNDLGIEGAIRWVDVDQENRKWFGVWRLGTDIDIVTYAEDRVWDSLTLPLSGVVGSQFIDSQGNKWFSTFGNSVCKLQSDNVTWQTYTDENYFNYIVALAEDSDGNIYFGSVQRGVSVLTPGGSLFKISGLPSEQVYDIAVDAQDEVWIGMSGSGVVVVRDFDVAANYTSSNSGLLGEIINDIAIDWQGNKYFFVENNGVSILKYTGEWDSITVSHGRLASDLIFDDLDGLVFDTPTGYLWIATKDGITRFDTGLQPPDSDTTLQDVDVFPNPFVMSRHTKVTFGKVPEGAEIFIYSSSMKKIRVIREIEQYTHRAFWYGTDEKDEPVDSGVYLFVILHPNGRKKIGKIAVVR